MRTRKYIVDIVGDLPVILMELDGSDNIKKMYIYANSQIIAQHNGDHADDRYFYLHDRLGSVRQIIDTTGKVVTYYSYGPFGQTRQAREKSGTNLKNRFMFTGQFYDHEIEQYYLRARQYDPFLARFTARDPAEGDFKEPLTLHRYLYCKNDPINLFDPDGASARSAALGVPQLSFGQYMDLWNNKIDPQDENMWKLTAWTALLVGAEEIVEYYGSGAGGALAPVSGGAALLFAGPNMYTIAYYRLLQHGMINAILREDFGIESGLYDLQDFRAGL